MLMLIWMAAILIVLFVYVWSPTANSGHRSIASPARAVFAEDSTVRGAFGGFGVAAGSIPEHGWRESLCCWLCWAGLELESQFSSTYQLEPGLEGGKRIMQR